MNTSDVLDAAADLIERYGRRRSNVSTTTGQAITPIEAIDAVGSEIEAALAAMQKLRRDAQDALRAEVRNPLILHWNNAEPDDAVVVNTMRHVAAQLREIDK